MSLSNPIIDLWPAGPPDGWRRNDAEAREHDARNNWDLVRNVSHPTLEIFRAERPRPHSATVIVCPGGGYSIEAIQHEGTEIAERLNRAGFNAAILKYRLPNRDVDKPLYKAPLQDAQRAIRLLRLHAADFGFDKDKIGIMGFSAGGHLAAVTSNTPEATYAPVDLADSESAMPSFTVLAYPAYLDVAGRTDLTGDVHVTAATPPAFIVQAMDDHNYIASSFAYAFACQKAGAPAELHLYPHGGHGFGIRTKEPGVSGWMDLLIAWLGRVK